MENNEKNPYSEVLEILKLIDDEKKLEALPMEMLEMLKTKSNPEYKPQISMEIPLDEQHLNPETLKILAWIAGKYWNFEEYEENIENTRNIETNVETGIDNNQIVVEENIEDKNIQSIQENQEISENIEKDTENMNILPIEIKHLKWYEKIKNKIIDFINKIFKRNINKNQEKSAI